MDFTIDRADLLAAINKCQLVIDSKHPTESFRLMLVESKKKSARFAAAGEFASVATVGEAEIKSQGSFIVPPSRLHDVASSMPTGRIRISLSGERVAVQSLVSKRKATFQRHTGELRPTDDPGSKAPWKEVDSHELVRALRMVKHASTWNGRDDPTVSLLIPTERGLDVFGCNSYLVTLVETNIRIDGEPIQVPEATANVLALMVETDHKVRIFCDGMRTYLETGDTIVSALLAPQDSPHSYKFTGGVAADSLRNFIIGSLRGPGEIAGPVLLLSKLQQGLKSVIAMSGFAKDSERGHAYGFQVHTVFGNDTVSIELGLSAADARDEFDVVRPGAEVECWLASRFLEQLLSSLTGVEEMQVLAVENLIVLRSQGVLTGIMKETPK